MSTLGNNLFAAYYAQQGLPYEYRRVEYIESINENYSTPIYINLPIDIQSFSRCDVDFMPKSTAAERYMGSNYGFTIVARSYSPLKWFNASAEAVDYIANKRVTISMIIHHAEKKKYYYIDGVLGQSTNKNTTYINNFYLFALSTESASLHDSGIKTVYCLAGQCYGVKYWDLHNKLAGNFIPCVRLSDSKPGLYDLCGSICPLTGTPFYINAGTGEFVIPT